MELEKVVEIVSIKQVVREHHLKNYRIKSPDDAVKIVQEEIGDDDREIFLVLVLSTKNEINAIYRCHVGSINMSVVSPREIFKAAILNNGASIIVAHNHPSSDVAPSREDIDVTKRLSEASKILGIEFLDHLIVGYDRNRFTSLKEKGYL